MKTRNKLISFLLTTCFILSAFAASFSVSAEDVSYDELPFTDVAESDWFYEDVQFCYGKGLIKGMSSDTFAPNEHLSRAMVVTMLHRLAGEPETENERLVFTDVPQDSWYTKAVLWAYGNEIVEGRTDTTFAPDEDVTRAELATFIYRYVAAEDLRISLALDAPRFADGGSVPEYAALPVMALYRSEIVKGKDGNRFDPTACATRAESAALLNRIVTLAPKQEYALLEKYGMTADVYMNVYGGSDLTMGPVHGVGIWVCIEVESWVDKYLIDDVKLKIIDTKGTWNAGWIEEYDEYENCVDFFVDNDYVNDNALIDGAAYIIEYTVTIEDESETYIAYETVSTVYSAMGVWK